MGIKTCQRIWGVIQPNLGRDTTESETSHDRIWDVVRSHLGRRSPTGIGVGYSESRKISARVEPNNIAVATSQQGTPRGHLAEAWGEAL